MSLIILSLYLIILIVRPSETIPFFRAIPLFNIFSFAILATIALNIKYLKDTFETRMLLLFFTAIFFSNISVGWFGGSIIAFPDILRLFLIFFSFKLVIRDEKKFLTIVWVLILLGLFLSAHGIIQQFHGVGFGDIEPILDESKGGVLRVRYSGILNDPNELGGLLLAILSYVVLILFTSAKNLLSKIILFTCVILSLFCIFFTYSRGTYIGVVLLVLMALSFYKSGVKSIAIVTCIAIFVAIQIPQVVTLLSTANPADESAGGRIDAWREGFMMLRSHPILGVGYGRFTEFNWITAHNSFVLAFSETGILGLYFYIGFLYAIITNLFSQYKNATEKEPLVVATIISISTTLWSMFFLSRTYSPISFIVFGLCASVANFSETEDATKSPYIKTAIITFCILLILFIAVKLKG